MASDWKQGKPRAFLKPEMTDELGYAILQASAAFLLAFPFVEIDGPLRWRTRLHGGSAQAGARSLRQADRRLVLHVIYLVTPIEQIPLSRCPARSPGWGATSV